MIVNYWTSSSEAGRKKDYSDLDQKLGLFSQSGSEEGDSLAGND